MSGKLTVKVVDRDSMGIADAQVVVQKRLGPARPASEAESVAETNIHGCAVFSLEAGTYLVSASKSEYRAEPRTAQLRLAVRDGEASPSSLRILLLPRIDREDLADDAVGYEQIGSDAVYTYQIAAGAVGADQLAPKAVGADQLADDAVEYEHIAASAVAGYQIADNAVSTEHIADKAVAGDKIADGAVSARHLSAELQAATSLVAGRVIVAKEGGDHASLSDAVAALSVPAETATEAAQPVIIDVMPGVYEEPSGIRLPPRVNLRGAGRECTEIRFAKGGLTVDDGNECAVSSLAILSPDVALRINSSAVRVDNCFLSGGDIGISAQASTLLARGNILRKGARGVCVLGCALRLLSNELEQLTVCGLEIRKSNARVLWNTFTGNVRDLDVREMQGGRRCLVSFNIMSDIVADQHARTRVFDAQNLTAAAEPLPPWDDL